MYVLSDSKNHRIMVSLHHELQPEHMPHEGVIQEQFQRQHCRKSTLYTRVRVLVPLIGCPRKISNYY